MRQSSLCLLSLLGGAVIGSIVALAFAPKSGSEMRGMVRDLVNEGINKFSTCGADGHKCGCEEK